MTKRDMLFERVKPIIRGTRVGIIILIGVMVVSSRMGQYAAVARASALALAGITAISSFVWIARRLQCPDCNAHIGFFLLFSKRKTPTEHVHCPHCRSDLDTEFVR